MVGGHQCLLSAVLVLERMVPEIQGQSMVYYVLDSAVSALAHILHEPCRWRIQANNAHSMAAVLVGLRLCRSFDGHQ